MIVKIFAVYDGKAEAFQAPLFTQTIGLAVRMFGDACNNPETNFYRHPEDFTLFELGEFDDASAKFELLSTPKAIGLAQEFKRSGEAVNVVRMK